MEDERKRIAAGMPAATQAIASIVELAAGAFIDKRSGLLNVAALEVLREQYDADPKAKLGVVFVDMARFKEINEHHSHEAGNTAIRIVAEQLRTMATAHAGNAYRYGGDEFVVIVPADRLPAFVKDAEHRSVSAFKWQGDKVDLELTIGYCATIEGATLDTLVANAEDACRRAKASNVSPKAWSVDDKTELPRSVRRRCQDCNTTSDILFYASKLTDGLKCPLCSATLPGIDTA